MAEAQAKSQSAPIDGNEVTLIVQKISDSDNRATSLMDTSVTSHTVDSHDLKSNSELRAYVTNRN